jgi:hypothetical protein
MPTHTPSTPVTPSIRYIHDADELRRLADWLDTQRDFATPTGIPLDYFRLSARLSALAQDAREFAEAMAGPIP